jgi:hypothetical protein
LHFDLKGKQQGARRRKVQWNLVLSKKLYHSYSYYYYSESMFGPVREAKSALACFSCVQPAVTYDLCKKVAFIFLHGAAKAYNRRQRRRRQRR